MKTIREKSVLEAEFIFEDVNRRRFVPQTVRYRLDNLTVHSRTTIIDWTSVTPQSAVVVQIPSSANRILDNCNRFETRLITVQSDYDTDTQMSEDEEYRVRNLGGFT